MPCVSSRSPSVQTPPEEGWSGLRARGWVGWGGRAAYRVGVVDCRQRDDAADGEAGAEEQREHGEEGTEHLDGQREGYTSEDQVRDRAAAKLGRVAVGGECLEQRPRRLDGWIGG